MKILLEKNIWILFVSVSLIIAAVFLYSRYRIAPAIKMEQIFLNDFSGNEYTLASKNQLGMVVVFYATWCGSCKKDFPLLEKLHHELSVQNVSFVAISDEPIEKTEKYCSAVLKVFDCYKLNTNFREIGIHKIPTVYVINKNGEVVFDKAGNYNWGDSETTEKIKQLLE